MRAQSSASVPECTFKPGFKAEKEKPSVTDPKQAQQGRRTEGMQLKSAFPESIPSPSQSSEDTPETHIIGASASSNPRAHHLAHHLQQEKTTLC